MKCLLILLFFFSINSFSSDLNEKALICIDEQKYKNKNIAKSDYIFGYIFKYDSANYYYNAVMNNGMYEINNHDIELPHPISRCLVRRVPELYRVWDLCDHRRPLHDDADPATDGCNRCAGAR